MIAQQDLTAEVLATTLEKIATRDACLQMALAAKSIYQGEAVKTIINYCEEVLNG
jgi:UDP-N-acetylglucosamine:LPS N-acetylglucosamine transferase